MKCDYVENGCEWVGSLNQLDNHVTTCDFIQRPCKYKRLGCKTELMKRDMAEHEKDDKLHLHMAIDTITQLDKKQSTLKHEEAFMFEVTGFTKKREDKTKFSSPSFYTSPRGYHMNIVVFASGYGSGEGTHVSVFANFLEGDNDDVLSWPFVGDIEFTLLNQLEDDSHLRKVVNISAKHDIRPVGGERNCKGCIKFIRHTELDYNEDEDVEYLDEWNDTLYFKVSVEVYDHKPWLEYAQGSTSNSSYHI